MIVRTTPSRAGTTAAVLRARITDKVLLGATLRGLTSTYEEPGSAFSPFPGTADLNNNLATVFGEVQITDGFTSRLTGAY